MKAVIVRLLARLVIFFADFSDAVERACDELDRKYRG